MLQLQTVNKYKLWWSSCTHCFCCMGLGSWGIWLLQTAGCHQVSQLRHNLTRIMFDRHLYMYNIRTTCFKMRVFRVILNAFLLANRYLWLFNQWYCNVINICVWPRKWRLNELSLLKHDCNCTPCIMLLTVCQGCVVTKVHHFHTLRVNVFGVRLVEILQCYIGFQMIYHLLVSHAFKKIKQWRSSNDANILLSFIL